jgi:hypothetical protein
VGTATDLMRVEVNPDPAGARVAIGTPEPLGTYEFYHRRIPSEQKARSAGRPDGLRPCEPVTNHGKIDVRS